MMFGIILKATNAIHFKNPLDFWCEFVPQLFFMHGVFGYMCWLVIFKWNICWIPAEQTLFEGADGSEVAYECTGKLQDSDAPPDIKQILIAMFMDFGSESNQQNLFAHQNAIQIPLVSTPFLIFGAILVAQCSARRLSCVSSARS
jgi:V-type H+-transporting ATPase subunit a